MQWLLGWAGLFWAAALAGAAEVAPPEGGTLLFLENVSSLVERTTHGQIGHAALVFRDGETCYVYEATPSKVRRVTWSEYNAELARINQRKDEGERIKVWLLKPKAAYTEAEIAKMRRYLDAQMGRRYSVRNYVKGKPGEPHSAQVGPVKFQVAVETDAKALGGIHCAELASTTLNQSGRYAFENCHKINPQALYTALLSTHAAPQELSIAPPAAVESWCQRAQRRTSHWFTWCGWSCREAWAWCW